MQIATSFSRSVPLPLISLPLCCVRCASRVQHALVDPSHAPYVCACAQTLVAVLAVARDTARWVAPDVGFDVLGILFRDLVALGARAAGGGARDALACCDGGGGISVGLSARQVCAS